MKNSVFYNVTVIIFLIVSIAAYIGAIVDPDDFTINIGWTLLVIAAIDLLAWALYYSLSTCKCIYCKDSPSENEYGYSILNFTKTAILIIVTLFFIFPILIMGGVILLVSIVLHILCLANDTIK